MGEESRRLKVLVVEDSPSDCELIVAELRRAGYTVDWRRAEGRHDLEEALEWGPNIVLVDHNLPQLDSLQALEVVRQSGVQAPLIIVSGQMEDDVGLVALRQGAADYLFKDSLGRLPAAVERALQRDRLGTPLIGSELDAVITMDAAGDVVHWNDVAERLFGWTATEAGGRSLFTLVLPQRFQEAQRHAVSEVMARHRTGMEFPAELSLSVGAAASAMVIARVRDLTEQKEAERRRVQDVEARFGLEAAIRRELLAQVLQAQEEERGRVARDLHDQIGQTLTSLRLALSVAEQSAKDGAGGDSLASQLADLRNQVGESIAEVRRIARDLRPSVLDELGLEAALRRHIADWSDRTAIAATLHVDNLAADVHSDVRTAVYRIVQEALNNVAKHSQASAVSVFLRGDAWTLRVLIEDDGVGFEPATAEDPLIGRGMGLRSMAERAQLLGGKFWVEAAPGVGTTVALELPL
jgi:PAS domain S-box-containing protein